MPSGALRIFAVGQLFSGHPFATEQVIDLGLKYAAIVERRSGWHMFKRKLSDASADAAFANVVQSPPALDLRAM